MSSSLKSKAVKGVGWNIIEKIAVNLFKFSFGVVLARLLLPEEFGLIAMVGVFFVIADVFVEGGFGQAYIQKKVVNQIDANTVFIVNLSVSILIYLLLYVFSEEIAQFYNENRLVTIIRVMGIIVLINAFRVVQIAQIRRDLNFEAKAKISIGSVIVSGSIGVVCAYLGLGVWSLVIQQILNRFILSTGLYFASNWRFKAEFSRSSFYSMFSFGSWLLLANIFKTTFDNIYKLAIGRFFSASELGYFTKSKQFQGLITEQFSWAIRMVSFPVFSQVQDQRARISNSLIKFLKYSSFITVPILGVLIVVAKPFVIILLTEKWVTMVPYLQLLCVVGMMIPIYDINLQVIQSLGKSKTVFFLGLVRNILRIFNIYLFYDFGIEYIIIGEIVLVFISYMINCIYLKKFIGVGFSKQVKALRFIFTGTGIAASFGYYIYSMLEIRWLQLLIPTFIILLLYMGFMLLFQRELVNEIYSLRKSLLRIN